LRTSNRNRLSKTRIPNAQLRRRPPPTPSDCAPSQNAYPHRPSAASNRQNPKVSAQPVANRADEKNSTRAPSPPTNNTHPATGPDGQQILSRDLGRRHVVDTRRQRTHVPILIYPPISHRLSDEQHTLPIIPTRSKYGSPQCLIFPTRPIPQPRAIIRRERCCHATAPRPPHNHNRGKTRP
jgi:hypothetical protein